MSDSNDWVDDALEGQAPIMTVREACKVLRISQRHFYRLVAAGKITAPKVSEGRAGRLLVPRSALEKYLRGLDSRAA